MKQILRLGERYGLAPVKRHVLYTLLISLYILLLPTGFARAQSANVKDLGIPEGGLKIGDTIPDTLWHLPLQVVNHPEGKDTITLNDYRGKLIILDFWATWCTACIQQFSKMDSLQKQFDGQFQPILVSQEPGKLVQSFLSAYFKRESALRSSFSVVAEKVLNACFPHRIIPHYAWIGPKGNVVAITDPREVQATTIRKVLQRQDAGVLVKKDLDISKPLFLTDDIGSIQLQHYSILLKGYYPGLGNGARQRKQGQRVVGQNVTNHDLFNLYAVAVRQLFKENNEVFSRSRCIMEVKDSVPLDINPHIPFEKNTVYTYDLILQPAQAKNLYHVMLDDLNRCTGYYGHLEKREVGCLVIVPKAPGGPPPSTQHLTAGSRRNVTFLVNSWNWMNRFPPISLTLLDESNYDGGLDEGLFAITDPVVLDKALSAYNLCIRPATRELTMLIIKD